MSLEKAHKHPHLGCGSLCDCGAGHRNLPPQPRLHFDGLGPKLEERAEPRGYLCNPCLPPPPPTLESPCLPTWVLEKYLCSKVCPARFQSSSVPDLGCPWTPLPFSEPASPSVVWGWRRLWGHETRSCGLWRLENCAFISGREVPRVLGNDPPGDNQKPRSSRWVLPQHNLNASPPGPPKGRWVGQGTP